MIPIIYFWLLLALSVVYSGLCCYIDCRLNSKIKRMRVDSLQNQRAYEANKKAFEGVIKSLSVHSTLIENKNYIAHEKIKRLTTLIQKLRKRQVNFVRSITWFKTEETDIRVLKVQAREQLAIDLENGGAIEYLISENYRPDIQETEITVKARIKTLNMK